jgi:hypothetical protein
MRPVALEVGTGDFTFAAGHRRIAISLMTGRSSSGSIGVADLLRHDALSAKPAGVGEDDRAVVGDVFVA